MPTNAVAVLELADTKMDFSVFDLTKTYDNAWTGSK
jgi:hypothetical protein